MLVTRLYILYCWLYEYRLKSTMKPEMETGKMINGAKPEKDSFYLSWLGRRRLEFDGYSEKVCV